MARNRWRIDGSVCCVRQVWAVGEVSTVYRTMGSTHPIWYAPRGVGDCMTGPVMGIRAEQHWPTAGGYAVQQSCSFWAAVLFCTALMGCNDSDPNEQRISAAEEAYLSVQAQEGNVKAAKRLEQIRRDRIASSPEIEAYAPGISDGWHLPAGEVTALTNRATAGDVEAADRLLQYYYANENEAKIKYWEEWLFERGDRGAIQKRAQALYSASQSRLPWDPKKLVELKEAERLERSVTADSDESLFLDKIRSKIAALEGER